MVHVKTSQLANRQLYKHPLDVPCTISYTGEFMPLDLSYIFSLSEISTSYTLNHVV